jgi:hypothetical protein
VHRRRSLALYIPASLRKREQEKETHRGLTTHSGPSRENNGTFKRMKSFHITVSEGAGDPVRRSASGHPPRRGIFRGEICGMRSSGSAPQARPKLLTTSRFATQTGRGSYSPSLLLSKPLSSSHPPSATTSASCLSLLCLCIFV